MKIAMADSPYLGCCKLYGHFHNADGDRPFDGRCWDDVNTHRLLIDWLAAEFDGWALCLSARSLQQILTLCPDGVIVLSWCKPIAPPMGDGYQYSWEPVIVSPVRKPATYVKTHLVESPPQFTFRPKPAGHVIGEKPDRFSTWVLAAMGASPTDDFTDLFTGSGAVGRTWDDFAGQLDLSTGAHA